MENWTAPAIASLRGDNTIPLQKTFASLTEYLRYLSTQTMAGNLPAGGTAGQILSKIDGTDYNAEWIENFAEKTKCLVKSDNAATLPKGAVVYTSGANGTNILVKGAIATSDATSATVIGLLETSLAYNDQGYVVTEGLVSGIDTSAAVAGDPVWLSPTTVGGLLFGLANKPHAPYHLVYLGVVTRAHAVNGEINVHMLNGWELDELHNVAAVSPSNGDTIVYNSTTSLWEKGKYPAAQLSGTALPATIVTSSLTSVGTLSSGSIPSTLLTGTIASARLSGSYTGITGVGTITTGTWSGSFGSVSGANLTSLNASNLSSGTVASARLSGSYTGITAVGTLAQNLIIDGPNTPQVRIGDWTSGATYTAIEASGYGYILLGSASDSNVYVRASSGEVRIGVPTNNTLRVDSSNVINTGTYISVTPATGSGNAAQWALVFGNYLLVRNTSTRNDKENFQPLNGAITPSMVDDINVELWCRKGTGFPEVGPMAEDMDAISPYLSNRGMGLDDDGNIVATPPNGINQNAWLSLLTIALQDCRRRITELESR